ncbi:MAG: PIG-L family deacetylase, partial [Armatimonadota bacterium]|nr:PIG-L family deacetylase [Armatimonadota bacterium]
MKKVKLSKALKLASGAVVAVAAGFAVVALLIQYRIRVANDWQRYAKLPTLTKPNGNDSLVVFAPHCDDETLGCGGLLAMANAKGAKVRVVLITNGDGYRIGVARAYGTIRVTPEMCIKYAYRRQKETLLALGKLGISKRQVTFLGYPDRGISALWTEHWSSETLYVSNATKTDRSPYANSFTLRAPYCGESLLRDILSILIAEKPTIVCAPHPFDDHPDHYAAYCFVAAAITQLGLENPKLAARMRLLTYLVHRGDWPVPRGEHVNEPLAPPYALSGGETEWFTLPLSSEAVQAKKSAIRCYKSQTALEKGFLTSFARRNEIFGVLQKRTMPNVQTGTITVDGSPADWKGIRPELIDPTGDHLLREISKGGDVRAVYTCTDGRFLYLRIDCARPLSKRIIYTTNIRVVSEENNSAPPSGNQMRSSNISSVDRSGDSYTVVIKPGSFSEPESAISSVRKNVLEIALPHV